MYTISSCFCNKEPLFFWMRLCLAKHFNACESIHLLQVAQVAQVAASLQHLLILVDGLYLLYMWLQFWGQVAPALKGKICCSEAESPTKSTNLRPNRGNSQFHNPYGCCNSWKSFTSNLGSSASPSDSSSASLGSCHRKATENIHQHGTLAICWVDSSDLQ